MSNKKISELLEVSEIEGNDIILIVNNGENKKIVFSNFVDSFTKNGEVIDGNLTISGNVSANGAFYVSDKQTINTVITNTTTTSAIKTILAVSQLPISQDPNTLYVII